MKKPLALALLVAALTACGSRPTRYETRSIPVKVKYIDNGVVAIVYLTGADMMAPGDTLEVNGHLATIQKISTRQPRTK